LLRGTSALRREILAMSERRDVLKEILSIARRLERRREIARPAAQFDEGGNERRSCDFREIATRCLDRFAMPAGALEEVDDDLARKVLTALVDRRAIGLRAEVADRAVDALADDGSKENAVVVVEVVEGRSIG